MSNRKPSLTRFSSLPVLALAFLCLALAGWWGAKPYRAFEHDAVFYMAEALARAGWADFSKDLFFRYGSQGEFSPLMGPYALLVKTWGVHASAWGVTLMGKLVWLGGACWLARSLLPTRAHACVALAAVLMAPSFYPANDIFNYGESFASPRLLSEALVLMGLAATVSARRWWGLLLVFGAFVVHPLMGACACAVVLVWRPAAVGMDAAPGVSWGHCLGVLVLGSALMLVGAHLGVRPLDRLFMQYDPAWWEVVRIRNEYAIVQTWPTASLLQLGVQCVFLGLAALANPPRTSARALAQATLAVMLACLCAWVVGCLMRNVLIIQLQPWRVLWLVQWLMPVLWISVFRVDPRAWRPADQVLAALVAAGILAEPIGAAALALLVGVQVWRPELAARYIEVRWQRNVAFLILALVLMAKLLSLPDLATIARVTTNVEHPWYQAVGNEPAVGVAVGWLLLCLYRCSPLHGWAVWATGGVALMLAVSGFAVWVSHGMRMGRAEEPWAVELRQRLPKDSVVYSNEPFPTLWLDLRRSVYADKNHGASALFNREQALELHRRMLRLSQLGLSDWPAHARGETSVHALSPALIAALCREPEIDVVLAYGHWPQAIDRVTTARGQELSVFECRQAGGHGKLEASRGR